MRSYQVTGKQLVVLALVTAVFAASAVVLYDKVGAQLLGKLAGATEDDQRARTAARQVAGI